MDKSESDKKIADRKLGDEWIDWDGRHGAESSDADYRVFLGLAVLSTLALIMGAGLFLWLIYPRLAAAGSILPKVFSILFLIFGGILVVWLILFVLAAVTRWPFTRLIVIPQLV
ncbi:MAG: hypothetical protein NTV06_02300, partial [candidate division Zixibacteria bacterium]|nr:hypothetical protein [candidate division Zixibacteria bacterium]